jgi:hypothetical protein
MTGVLVHLEVDGVLVVCRVGEPYSSIFRALNGIPRDAGSATIDHIKSERKRLAAEVVAMGAYQIHEKQ